MKNRGHNPNVIGPKLANIVQESAIMAISTGRAQLIPFILSGMGIAKVVISYIVLNISLPNKVHQSVQMTYQGPSH